MQYDVLYSSRIYTSKLLRQSGGPLISFLKLLHLLFIPLYSQQTAHNAPILHNVLRWGTQFRLPLPEVFINE